MTLELTSSELSFTLNNGKIGDMFYATVFLATISKFQNLKVEDKKLKINAI